MREASLDVASSKYGLDIFKHIAGKDTVFADQLSRIYAPGGADTPPEAVRQPGVVFSKVAKRDDD